MSLAVVAVVLAAGGGTRFDGDEHKLLTPFRGRPLVAWALETAAGSGAAHTFVVTGAVDLGPALAEVGVADRITLVANPGWAEGQATSLAAGIAAADAVGAEAAVVGLGDQPLIGAEAWRRLVAADEDRPIVVATYGGRRRNPVRLARSVWSELPEVGDQGARGLMARRPELVAELPCPGEPVDVDTLEDLTRWS